MNEFGKLLPSEFIPQLRELAPSMKIEGGMKDYELPDINEEIPEYAFGFSPQQSSSNQSSADVKRYNDLQKECNLLKEEHKSNIKELNTKIEDLELQIRLKSDKNSELQKVITSRESDISKMRLDIEKLMKNLKDVTLQHSMNMRQSEDTLARKCKEVECLVKEKKCKNCILCLEDLKDKSVDYALI